MKGRGTLTAVVTAGALLIGGAGCGSSTQTPGEAVPGLETRLQKVDSALAGLDYDDARKALNGLVATTERAREAGRISEARADRILAAIARLAAALPQPTPTPSPSPTAPPPTEDQGDEKGGEKGGEKKDEEEKDEDGEGDGHSSDDGPDDGHGN